MAIEVTLANTAEPYAQALESISPPLKLRSLIQCEHDLASRALFWGPKADLVILPRLPPPAHMAHVREAVDCIPNQVLAPQRCATSLCQSIVDDKQIFQVLVQFMKENVQARVSAYAVTPQYGQLIELLRREGAHPEAEDWHGRYSGWLTRYLDSKAGFRLEVEKICQHHRRMNVPQGFLCDSHSDAIAATAWFTARGHGCVVKANYGQSGWGLHFVRRGTCGGDADLRGLERKFSDDEIWRSGALIVEQMIEPAQESVLRSPCIELFIDDAGPRITCACSQVIGEHGEFCGIELGPSVLPATVRHEIEVFALAVASHFAKLGVRGHFDIDFVVSNSNTIFAVETNVRRSAVTHVAGLRHLLGPQFENAHFLSEDWYQYGSHILAPDEIFERLSSILFERTHRTGAIITVVSETSPAVGYVIVSDRREQALAIQETVRSALS